MIVTIKQNPYNASWIVTPVCPIAKMKFRSEEGGITNYIIGKWMGRDWMQRYMHGEFGMGVLEVEIPDNAR